MPSGRTKQLKLLLPIILGFFLISSTLSYYYQKRILSFASVPEFSTQQIKASEAPSRIIIPSVKIDLPIDEGTIKNGVWQISDVGASFLDVSAKPGSPGNIVVYGHNKRVIFGNLSLVHKGDTITLMNLSGDEFVYKVESISTVKPTEVSVIAPTDYEVLTVYTCNGLFDSTRLIIKAKPI